MAMATKAITDALGSNTTNRGGCIVLIDVPPGSSITLDGITRVTPSSLSSSSSAASSLLSPLHRGLCIIRNVPCSISISSSSSVSSDGSGFHLLVVRSGPRNDAASNNNSNGRGALPVGFVLGPPAAAATTTSANCAEFGYEWIFGRRYDPHTEEISNQPMDELTLTNIVGATERGGELHPFCIPYDQFVSGKKTDGDAMLSTAKPSWEARTSMISARYLQRRHGIAHGAKLVPSTTDNDTDANSGGEDLATSHGCNDKNGAGNSHDGRSASYPPMPCIDPSIHARRLMQHRGTRTYLSKLSPEERTRLLHGSEAAPGELVWNDALQRYYGNDGGNGAGSNRSSSSDGNNDGSILSKQTQQQQKQQSQNDFLADLQLSFLLFLFLECHASLEHWRDGISMCSLATVVTSSKESSSSSFPNTTTFVPQHCQFFMDLLSTLYHQLSCIETEFFRDADYSAGEENFMVSALRHLCSACERSSGGKRKRTSDGEDWMLERVKCASQRLRSLVRDRFGLDLSSSILEGNDDVDDEEDMEMEGDAYGMAVGEEAIEDHLLYGCTDHKQMGNTLNNQFHQYIKNDDDGNDDIEDDEDGPVIVPYDQIEESMARSSSSSFSSHVPQSNHHPAKSHCKEYSKEYPLLYASMTMNEDEVMACARILDEKRDVSLVREAAAYLEEVEARR